MLDLSYLCYGLYLYPRIKDGIAGSFFEERYIDFEFHFTIKKRERERENLYRMRLTETEERERNTGRLYARIAETTRTLSIRQFIRGKSESNIRSFKKQMKVITKNKERKGEKKRFFR